MEERNQSQMRIPAAAQGQGVSIHSRWKPILFSWIFLTAMVAVSDAMHLPELLFPEMCAILCGAWILPKQPWRANRMWIGILLCTGAVFGVLVNRFLPWPLWVRAPLGFLFCAVLMLCCGAEMPPMLSATILPMLLGTTSWVYPLAVAGLVILALIGQILLERGGLREPVLFRREQKPSREQTALWLRRILVLCLFACPAYAAEIPFLAVPPLLVAFVELTKPETPLQGKPIRTWICLSLSAGIGSLGKAAVEANLFPPAAAAAACILLLFVVWEMLQLWFPPAGAIVLLAFIAPWRGPWIYFLESSLGAALWIVLARVLFSGSRRGKRIAAGATAEHNPD
jgi:hypothetical protein